MYGIRMRPGCVEKRNSYVRSITITNISRCHLRNANKNKERLAKGHPKGSQMPLLEKVRLRQGEILAHEVKVLVEEKVGHGRRLVWGEGEKQGIS